MPNVYETEKLLAEYLLFHYGEPTEILPYSFGPKNALDFATRCVTENVDTSELNMYSRALDIGCAVGRTTFELARHCGEVVGIDYSQAFVDAGNTLQREGFLDYRRLQEGDIYLRSVAAVDPDIDRSRVAFETGDAQDLSKDLGGFHVVLACNVICRLREPLKLLQRLPSLVLPGGQLVVTTPFTWLEEFTPKENWLGGTAAREDSFNGLRRVLEADFELMTTRDMPFIIREHARKFQWSVAQATTWKRK